MYPGLFLRGFLIGLSIAATVGPMCILCIRRTLADGWAAGLATGLGTATADGCYAAVAGFGLTAISNVLIGQRLWLHLIGGIFLCILGIRTVLAMPAARAAVAAGATLTRMYLSALGLTLTNPLTIISFGAIFAGLGAASGIAYEGAIALVPGVFAGSVCWWIVLTAAVGFLRTRMTPRLLRAVNLLSGAIILGFGLLALASF